MFLLLGDEGSVGPISAVHSHRYCAKKIALFERAQSIFYNCDGFATKLISKG